MGMKTKICQVSAKKKVNFRKVNFKPYFSNPRR